MARSSGGNDVPAGRGSQWINHSRERVPHRVPFPVVVCPERPQNETAPDEFWPNLRDAQFRHDSDALIDRLRTRSQGSPHLSMLADRRVHFLRPARADT